MEKIIGVNDQEEWNKRISEMQAGLDFEPLVEFLEKLKEPIPKDDYESKASDNANDTTEG